MSLVFWLLKWWLIVCVVSALGTACIVTWDWFVYRRLPWLRWRASRREDDGS